MKRELMSGLLALTMVGTLTACGGTTGNQPTTESSTPSGEVSDSTEEKLSEFKKTATLAETVMVDEGGVKITATGLSYTEFDVELNLLIENNSGQTLTFTDNSINYEGNAINGMMLGSGQLLSDIGDGKKAKESIRYSYEDLILLGIDEIADMEIALVAMDEEYDTVYEGIHQVKTSAFDTYDYETNHYQEAITSQENQKTYQYETVYFSQDSQYEQNGVKLLSSGMIVQDGEYFVLLEFENTSDSMMYVGMFDVAINGLKLSSSGEEETGIYAGKRCIMSAKLSDMMNRVHLDEYGVSEVSTVSFSLGSYKSYSDLIYGSGELFPMEIAISDGKGTFDASGNEVYNSNGIRIVTKGLQEDEINVYALMLVENTSGNTVAIYDVYNSLSVNGFMTDFFFSDQEVKNGESAVMVLDLPKMYLEESDVTSASEVQEIEVGFEIEEGYTTIDEPTITLQFG